MMAVTAALCLLPQIPALARSNAITGRVVAVHDGDTVTLLTEDTTTLRIRLDGIDAPESDQPFGKASKKSLSDLVFGKTVRVVTSGIDPYGRTLGHIYAGEVWANLAQVEQGMAWQYTHYSNDGRLHSAEAHARAAHLGLWQDKKPIPPWDWRHHKSQR